MREESSQLWLLSKMDAMKAVEEEEGEIFYGAAEGNCAGYAWMSILAFLENRRNSENKLEAFERFQARVKRIRLIPLEVFKKHMQELYNKRQRIMRGISKKATQEEIENEVAKHFSEQELLDLSIANFFDGIELGQQLYKHEELHDKNIKGQSAEAVFPLLASEAIANAGGIKPAAMFTAVFLKNGNRAKQDELTIFFEEMRTQFKTLDFPVSMSVFANGHIIAVHYDPLQDEWRMVDANEWTWDGWRLSKHGETIFTMKDSRELAAKLHAHFRVEPLEKSDHSLITTTLYITANNQPILQEKLVLLKRRKAFSNLFAVTQEKLQVKDNNGFTWKENIIFSGEVDALKNLLKQERSFDKSQVYKDKFDIEAAERIAEEREKNALFFHSRGCFELGQQVKMLRKKLQSFFVLGRAKKRDELKFLTEVLSLANTSEAVHLEEKLRNAIFINCARWKLQEKNLKNVFSGSNSQTAVLLKSILPHLEVQHKMMQKIFFQDKERYEKLRRLIGECRKTSHSFWSSKEQRRISQQQLDFLINVIDKATELATNYSTQGKTDAVFKEVFLDAYKSLPGKIRRQIEKGSNNKIFSELKEIKLSLESRISTGSIFFRSKTDEITQWENAPSEKNNSQ